MAIVLSISHFAPTAFTYLLLLSSTTTAINVTAVLSSFPDLSTFAALLTSSGVASELSGRNSLTLLAIPNSHLSSSAVNLTRRLPPSSFADLLRNHVLLQFLTDYDLRRVPPSGSTVTTLYEASGRAFSGSGAVNVTRDPKSGSVTIRSPKSSNATVLKLLETLNPNITVLAVDCLLVPAGIDLTASESLTPPPTLPSPPIVNLTGVLTNGQEFNVAISLLVASGVISDLENDERGAGITVFVPIDAAFADLPATVRLQSLPAEQKSVILKFHVLHSYYTLGSLQSITNPVQPTLATEEVGAGWYTLNISRVNGSEVTIDSGLVQAHVTRTVFDQKPVAVFGVSNVLLPRELFGKGRGQVTGSGSGSGQPGNTGVAASPAGVSFSPGNLPGSDSPPSHLLSPPEEKNSGVMHRAHFFPALGCSIGMLAFCVLV